MFPNARLMVVAILAAIAGIGCGLGLFATFRVNHEPLTRLAEGSPPLQLAIDNLALASDARLSLEARLPAGSAGKVISVPVVVPTPTLVGEPATADAALAVDSPIQEPAAADVAADQSNAASPAVAAEPSAPSSAAPEAIAIAPSQQEATTAAQDQQPADSSATTPNIEQTAVINGAAGDRQPTAKATKSEDRKAAKPAVRKTAKPARVSRPTAQARRPIKTVRVRATVTTAATQPTYQYSQPTYAQPTYTWADGTAQPSQTIKRVVVKRSRAAMHTAPAVQSNPSAGLSNSQ
jgi:hypothetical protein